MQAEMYIYITAIARVEARVEATATVIAKRVMILKTIM